MVGKSIAKCGSCTSPISTRRLMLASEPLSHPEKGRGEGRGSRAGLPTFALSVAAKRRVEGIGFDFAPSVLRSARTDLGKDADMKELAFLLLCGVPFHASGAEPADETNSRFRIRQDKEVLHVEPAPHDGAGQTKAYRYFDDVKDAGIVFRKRALPKDGAIGMHVLGHDEVYYIVSGHAELTVDDQRRTLQPSTAVYMSKGANVGIRQAGDDDLVLIVAYPAPK